MGLGGYSGQQLQGMGNQSASMSLSVSGLSTLWGKGILLFVLAGAVLSFIGPATVIPDGKQIVANQEKAIMAAVGGLAILLTLIVYFSASSYVNQDATVSSQYASSSASASVAWGWYIAVIAALAATVLGFLAPWQVKSASSPSSTD
jgi:hypothetical protein